MPTPSPPHTYTVTVPLSVSLCCLHYDQILLLFLKNNDWPKWSFKFVYCALITSLLMTWLKIMLLCCLEAHIAMLYLFIFWAGLCLSVSLHHVCHSPSLCAACIMTRYYYCTRRTLTDPNDHLNLMHWIFCLYWCELGLGDNSITIIIAI